MCSLATTKCATTASLMLAAIFSEAQRLQQAVRDKRWNHANQHVFTELETHSDSLAELRWDGCALGDAVAVS
jgi:predicted negative regulator of RcsB-dependent stress response